MHNVQPLKDYKLVSLFLAVPVEKNDDGSFHDGISEALRNLIASGVAGDWQHGPEIPEVQTASLDPEEGEILNAVQDVQLLLWRKMDDTPDTDRRVLALSPAYEPNDPMRIRTLDSQFLRTTTDVMRWADIPEPATEEDTEDK